MGLDCAQSSQHKYKKITRRSDGYWYKEWVGGLGESGNAQVESFAMGIYKGMFKGMFKGIYNPKMIYEV
ncbi:uncharacterized protein EAF02_004177 [Botrytis sinoallii]|uniref:uncharacterized protein n=1 Tax=Botrytis sinoallii TaxID=1463999 RepID=UPI00190279E7|nr:uncharacterized protein EAF02_004177 [Botrytis sinoallii]KAF7885668.1 hypothetical protein EAF02_004177 [Botrytis sinoallii]